MQVKAIQKDTGIPPRKVRLLVDMVRGKKVEDALNILKFTHTPHARAVAKVVKAEAWAMAVVEAAKAGAEAPTLLMKTKTE